MPALGNRYYYEQLERTDWRMIMSLMSAATNCRHYRYMLATVTVLVQFDPLIRDAFGELDQKLAGIRDRARVTVCNGCGVHDVVLEVRSGGPIVR